MHFTYLFLSIIITQQEGGYTINKMQFGKIISKIDLKQYLLDNESKHLVVPGQPIISEQDYMNGHGTYKSNGIIYASLMGTVEITNKLIIVNPLKSKYSPQIGDIVVGRVVEIASKRWKIDINANSDSYLNLNSAYITEQRKKNQEDEFNMRKIMQEDDYIVAEVQTSNADKTYNLHTRNPKYGKLEPGVLVQVPHKLIKKQKHHFITFAAPWSPDASVGIVLGNNGNIWLSGYNRNVKETEKAENEKNNSIKNGNPITQEQMRTISYLYNILRILCWEGLEISEALLKQLFKFIEEMKIGHDEITSQGKDKQIREYLHELIQARIPERLEQLSKNMPRT